jgi:hypothetical protein
MAFSLRGKLKAREDIGVRELRKILDQLRFARTACEIPQDLAHGQARSAHARLPEPNGRIDGNAFETNGLHTA